MDANIALNRRAGYWEAMTVVLDALAELEFQHPDDAGVLRTSWELRDRLLATAFGYTGEEKSDEDTGYLAAA